MVSEAVARGDVAALNYFIAEKYLKAFGKLAQSPNQKMLILPIEATSVLGSLAGIGEIAKATFGGRRRRQRRWRQAGRRAAQPDRAVRLHDARLYAAEELRERAMMEFLVSLGAWNWFIAAAVFFVLELIAPGAFMLWLGLSAMLVGIISFFVDWPWQMQLVAFAVFALASIPLWRRFARRVEKPGDQPFLNRRADAFVGRVFTLEKPIVDGVGTVRIDDTIWRVTGPDCPAGSRVKVVRAGCGAIAGGGARIVRLYATPARSRSCRCTMPTGLPASTTNSAVIFEELSISSASLTS